MRGVQLAGQGDSPPAGWVVRLLLSRKWKNMEMNNLFGHKSAFFAASGPIEFLVAGLGNPGKEYENTRHNAGFMAVDYMAKEWNFSVDRLKFKALCGDCMVAGKRVLSLKPSTFMNLSGQSVTEAAAFYKIPWERVIILSDEISLNPGKLRIRRKGSDGGHNGLKNIIYLSGSDNFPRIRIGVGQKPNPEYDLAAWVLSRFTEEDLKALSGVFPKAAQAVEYIVQGKIDQAMNQFNER